MEDEFSIIHYSPSQNEGKENNPPMSAVKPFIFFGIFDGHGGDMASKFSRDNLCNNIIRQHSFWSNDDFEVCRAIRNGFIATQKQMQAQVGKLSSSSIFLPFFFNFLILFSYSLLA